MEFQHFLNKVFDRKLKVFCQKLKVFYVQVELESVQKRVCAVEDYLRSLISDELCKFQKGELLGVVRAAIRAD